MFKKFLLLLKLFMSGKLEFSTPIKKDVVLYDKTKFQDLIKILDHKKINILHIRGEKLNFMILLKCLFKFKLRFIDYCNEYIKIVNPKIILSFLDNYPQFYNLNKQNYQKKILIQNAMRS